MFSVPASRVPRQGALIEQKNLAPGELGLSQAFGGRTVEIWYEITALGRKYLAKGRAAAIAELVCGRCLAAYEAGVRADFVLEFDPEALPTRESRQGDPEDLEGLSVVLFQGDTIPLGEEIRQEMELALPQAGLCRPDCKGLCDRCGADLNQGACACAPKAARNPFLKLKDFFTEKKEN
jgi:uncharacterized protein